VETQLQRLPGAAFIEGARGKVPTRGTRTALQRLPGAAFIEGLGQGAFAGLAGRLQRLPGAAFIEGRVIGFQAASLA